MSIDTRRLWPFLAGLILSVNVYLLPFLETSPRATDLAGACLAVVIIVRLARGTQPPGSLAAAGVVAAVPLIWLFFSLLDGQVQTAVLSVRWLLAIPYALALAACTEDRERQVDLARGLLVGGLVNVLVVVLQWLGFEGLLQAVGFSSSGANYTQFVSHQVRIPGLHGHHNASAAVTSLLVPAGFYLYYRHRLRLSWLLLAVAGLVATLHLTSTRSPLLVTIVTVVFVSALARRLRQSVVVGVILLSVLLPLLAVYGPPGGWARWKNTEALVSNASERQDSGLGAVLLCVDHPLGLGVGQGHIALTDRTGIRATHNAFLQAALVWGLPFGVLILAGVMVTASRGLGGGGSEGRLFLPAALAVQVAGLFMFEEHLNNPTFIVLSAWLVICAFSPAVSSGRSPGDGSTRSPS